jgi:hypothetical protein
MKSSKMQTDVNGALIKNTRVDSRKPIVSIHIIILLITHLSLNIKEMADRTWDIVWHGFSNVPKFLMSGISFLYCFIQDLGFFL